MRDEVDHVTGIAVLCEYEPGTPGKEFLHILCRSDRTRFLQVVAIPVAEEGKPHKHVSPESGPWRYRIEGDDILHVSPSVNRLHSHPIPGSPKNEEHSVFHNNGQWSVKFKRLENVQDVVRWLNAPYITEVKNHWRLYPKKK